MGLRFVLLRFSEDKNIADRGYWYLCDFPASAGERVLAPVGMHDRLQCAEVVRELIAEERDAPYDVRLIKRVAAKYGARKLTVNGARFLEFGGLRYDEKHYTRFCRILLAEETPILTEELRAYGAETILTLRADDPSLYERIAAAKGCAVLAGEEGKAAFSRLISMMRGEGEDLISLGVGKGTLFKLKEKLG